MKYRRLGNTGLKVSPLCLGTMTYGTPEWREWVLKEKDSRPFYRRALDAGINFFDTADTYSDGVSEEITGRALSKFVRREEYVLATKCYMPMGDSPNERGLSRKHILHAIDASLQRLGTDYVDLYQIHRWDYDTPIEETMEALHDVIKAGKARYIGASSMYAWQFAKAQQVAALNGWTRFATMQPLYNLIYREEEREMLPLCADQGVGVIPWSPLARGVLARAEQPGDDSATERERTDPSIRRWNLGQNADRPVLEAVKDVAREQDASPARVALAWLLSKSVVTAPIIGASKMEHLEDALAAVDLHLTDEQVQRLEEPYTPHTVAGHA